MDSRIRLDKIASATRNVNIDKDVIISDKIRAREGEVIAVKALEEKSVYNQLELANGRMARIRKGDIIVGVLGNRKALRGYVGIVPAEIKVGDILHILNIGGVIGKCVSQYIDIGPALRVEVLGSVLTFPSMEHRIGTPINIMQTGIKNRDKLEKSVPLVIVSGTCMSSGKTSCASEVIKYLNGKRYKVEAAKITGISAMKDILDMEDCGAKRCLDFTDAGIVSTSPEKVVPIAKGLIYELNKDRLNLIVIELGDGILGEYGVQSILQDKEIMNFTKAHVVCATDPVAAFGAVEQFKKYNLKIDVMAGPATDTEVGIKYIEKELCIQAINARKNGKKLGEIVEKKVFNKK